MRRTAIVLMACVGLASLIAPAGAAGRSNRFDAKKHPPHYTGKPPRTPGRIVHDLRAGPSFGDPASRKEVLARLGEFVPRCEAHLSELLGDSLTLEIPSDANPADLPEFYAGHPEGFWAPSDAWSDEDHERYGRHVVLLWLTHPPSHWAKMLAPAMGERSADHVLYVTLELSDYAVAQKNWKGSKAIELGTGYTMPVPWLTSLDQLAEVLQFKGVLYRADGGFVQAGAEAFHAQRTPFRESVFNVQRSMRADDLEAAFQATRPDLPGRPPAWQVALGNLVAQLTGRTDRLQVPVD